MVITVECPSCASSFPVDPNKVPEGGVNARCSSCAQVFRVEKPQPEPVPELPGLPEPEPVIAEAPPEPVVPEVPPIPVIPEAPPIPVIPEAPPVPVIPEAPGQEGSPSVQGFTFGKRDPTDKARRLARVLVSDMIMYNAERHQSALAAGTIVQDFEEEIDKSWKEYVEQVGDELANGVGRGFWREALNDILAKGEDLF